MTTVESFVAIPVERTMVPRLDRIPATPEPGLRRYDFRERNEPVTLPVSADGPSTPRSPKRQQYHYATWADAPIAPPPQHVFHSEFVTFVGHSTILHRTDTAAPFTFPRNSRPGRGLSVLWDKGAPRGGKLDRPITVTDRIEGPMLCFGAFPDHFGHFLLEAVPRFWAIDWARARGLPVVVLHGPELRDWQSELLRLAGIDPAELTYVDAPATLTDAFVPGPLYRLHHNYHPRFKDTLSAMTARLVPSGEESDRLFLGRGALRRGRRLRNEEEVAAVYREFGYRIMSPEQHSLTEQITAAAAARHIAGPIGSQLYLALFQREAVSTHVFSSPDFAFADDALIAAMNGGTCRFVFPETVTEGSVPRWDTFEIDPARVRAMLQAQFVSPEQSAN